MTELTPDWSITKPLPPLISYYHGVYDVDTNDAYCKDKVLSIPRKFRELLAEKAKKFGLQCVRFTMGTANQQSCDSWLEFAAVAIQHPVEKKFLERKAEEIVRGRLKMVIEMDYNGELTDLNLSEKRKTLKKTTYFAPIPDAVDLQEVEDYGT